MPMPEASAYLSASELADLIGCKANQRRTIVRWLENNGWPFVIDRNGIPTVARAYHDKKLGIEMEPASARLDAAADVFARRSARSLLRRPISLPHHDGQHDLDADQ